MKKKAVSVALGDISNAVARHSLVRMLGWQDLRQRYRRSALGPFWLTISMGVMIGTIGVVFGQIFKAAMAEFLPFLAVGMILWTFISTVIGEGCAGFIAAEGIIKQLPIPLFVHIMRLVWRNILILAHNIVILPFVFFAVSKSVGWVALYTVPGFLLLVMNLSWIALLLGVICTRYRDLPQIVTSVLQVVFYLTPIMWMPSLLPERSGQLVLTYNPFYHLLEVVRAPIMGQVPEPVNWLVSAVLAVSGWILVLVVYGRYKSRIAYWL
ncbi:ABC transporter permease [Pseudomonas asiatica]|uniref:ABC transporter permease n=1 Tax=Pseudomonas TaxID=286 RepID=UPI001BB049A1|nr:MULTISPECIES: ABC transporter permease [Pseudomonas]QUN69217.1 ABC transporter permease [Pseudomonas sp. JS425]WJM54980.1 ABC transporter permease [Pseudomonas asiatica]